MVRAAPSLLVFAMTRIGPGGKEKPWFQSHGEVEWRDEFKRSRVCHGHALNRKFQQSKKIR